MPACKGWLFYSVAIWQVLSFGLKKGFESKTITIRIWQILRASLRLRYFLLSLQSKIAINGLVHS